MVPFDKERGFLASALIALTLAIAAAPHLDSWFDRFLFGFPAWLAVIVSALVGFCCLRRLDARGWCSKDDLQQGALVAGAAALVFATIVIAADLTLGFPAGLNAPWPWSLAYYPAMAFIAAVAFHLIPLALLALVARVYSWPIIVAAALPEAVFQASQASGAVLQVFVALHVFALGVAALLIFRHYGFMAMLVMRLGYYALWHVAWGYARLHF